MGTTDTIELESKAYHALLTLEQLVATFSPQALARYMNCCAGELTSVFEMLKTMRPTRSMSDLAERFRRVFIEIQRHQSRFCQRLRRAVTHFFRRFGNILFCLMKRGVEPRSRPANAVLNQRENNCAFRAALMDRLADCFRVQMMRLRRDAESCAQLPDLPDGPIPLGASAARFVRQADTREGVLVMCFQDGHQELFNLTESQWLLILPLLTTTHELGHAKLNGRPQGLLTRHDANGDEIDGNGLYFSRSLPPHNQHHGVRKFIVSSPAKLTRSLILYHPASASRKSANSRAGPSTCPDIGISVRITSTFRSPTNAL